MNHLRILNLHTEQCLRQGVQLHGASAISIPMKSVIGQPASHLNIRLTCLLLADPDSISAYHVYVDNCSMTLTVTQ